MSNDSDVDLEASPYRSIWTLAWPQVLMMVFHFLIGFVDVWAAGRLGREVQATMGMITQALFFFMVVAIAVANGSVAAISQSIGAGLIKRSLRYVGLCLEVGLALSGVIALLGLLIKGFFLDLLQIPAEIAPIAEYLFTVYLYVLPFYYLFIISNAVFRAQKKVLLPLYAMIVVTVLNTAGDLLFGLGYLGFPRLGYQGLAWATFFSILAGMLFNLVALWRMGYLQKSSFAPWRWVRKAWPYLFKVAWPAGLMQVVWHSAYLVLYAITASLPQGSVVALAAMSAGIRVESLLFLPGFALNFTASILVGHFLGAGKPEVAKQVGYRILGVGVISITVLTGAVWLVIDPIVGFIAPDSSVQSETVNYLRFNMTGIPFLLTAMILGGALVGAGATLYQMFVFGIASWGIRIPLAFVLGHFLVGGATGIWAAMLFSMIMQALIMLYVYQSKDWQRFAMKKRMQRECGETPESVLPRR
ncbi:MAG: MATE family efflux transporter [Desulfovibrionales bacterium]